MTRRWPRLGIRYLILIIAMVLIVSACTAGVNPEVGVASAEGDLAGFWLGLWQGIISPVTFVVSLFTNNVNMYEVHNNGNWYDFGFVLGAGILFGGSGRKARRR